MKKKRRIRKFMLFSLLTTSIIVIAFLFINHTDNDEPLAKLGYSNISTDKLKEDDLDTKIDKYYKVIDDAIKKDSFNKKCFNSYIELKDINNVYKLCNLGYNDQEIISIINKFGVDSTNKITKYRINLISYIAYSHFNIDNYDIYNNSDIKDIGKKISYVNIGLNNPFYKNLKEAINLDTNLVLVNKNYKLSKNYKSNDLETVKSSCSDKEGIQLKHDARIAFEKLCDEAVRKKYTILASSGYRSYEYQKNLYNDYRKIDSESVVDTYSARAGHSEHQTGLAVDINNGTEYIEFGKTQEYTWIKGIAHKYGFIIRYTKEFTPITGYKDEPWHIRYVGVEVANYLYKNNITLEEYLLNNKIKIDLS